MTLVASPSPEVNTRSGSDSGRAGNNAERIRMNANTSFAEEIVEDIRWARIWLEIYAH
jgi:hypothetical protein